MSALRTCPELHGDLIRHFVLAPQVLLSIMSEQNLAACSEMTNVMYDCSL